jgi:hypothetical protein
MSKPKYKIGKKIETVADFEKSTCTFFKVGTKTTHRAWIESWQYRLLKVAIKRGILYETESIEKENK